MSKYTTEHINKLHKNVSYFGYFNICWCKMILVSANATQKYNDLLNLIGKSLQSGKKAYSSSLFSCFNKANQFLSLN